VRAVTPPDGKLGSPAPYRSGEDGQPEPGSSSSLLTRYAQLAYLRAAGSPQMTSR